MEETRKGISRKTQDIRCDNLPDHFLDYDSESDGEYDGQITAKDSFPNVMRDGNLLKVPEPVVFKNESAIKAMVV